MKKLFAILVLTLISFPAIAESNFTIKEIRTPTSLSRCQGLNEHEFAPGEFLVEINGKQRLFKADLAINGVQPTIKHLFNNWYHLVYEDMNCDDTIFATVSLMQIEGIERISYNFIMKIMGQ